MAKPINVGTVQVVDASSQATVGYGFTVDDGKSDRVERWLLYPEYVAPPTGTIILQEPTDAGLRFTNLDDWTKVASADESKGGLWRDGSKYIKSNFASYTTIPQSTPIPPDFPAPSPSLNPQGQLDGGMGILAVDTSTVGYVFTELLSSVQSHEYWVFTEQVSAPPSGAPMQISQDQAYDSLDNYLDGMRGLSIAKFVMVSSNTYDAFTE